MVLKDRDSVSHGFRSCALGQTWPRVLLNPNTSRPFQRLGPPGRALSDAQLRQVGAEMES